MTIPIDRTPGTLKPRAIAALCSLRTGPKTTVQIGHAIGDRSLGSTRDLMADLRRMFVAVEQIPGDHRWYLTHDGLGWLESNGLDAAPEALLWVAQKRVS